MNKNTNEAKKIPFIGLSMEAIKEMMKGKKIYTICKAPGSPLNLIQIFDKSDIIEPLKPIVRIDGDEIVVESREGIERAKLGSFVAFEKSNSTECGYNAWIKGNALETTVEIDGKRYNKQHYVLAEKMTTGPSELLGEDNKKVIENANKTKKTYPTPWGDVTGSPDEAYWVKYGIHEDGSIDANILNKSEESYRQYILCDDDGNYLCYLHEFDPA